MSMIIERVNQQEQFSFFNECVFAEHVFVHTPNIKSGQFIKRGTGRQRKITKRNHQTVQEQDKTIQP